MMLSSATPPKTKTKRPFLSLKKQHLVLQVLQAMHDKAGRPNPFHVKAVLEVPFDDKFPPKLHGKRLDMSNLRLDKREGRLDVAIVAQLDAMGFLWDLRGHQWHENKWALETYKKLHDNLMVPVNYEVPSDDPSWPPELWTKHLGKVVDNLRQSKPTLAPDKKQWLDAMGFVWDAKEAQWQSNLKALQTYKAIHGDLLVPTAFVVPRQNPQWPKHLWGWSLGNAVARLRRHHASMSPQKRDVLNDMGFALRVMAGGQTRPVSISPSTQHDFIQIARAQRSQQLHKNFVTFTTTFEVPNQDPWPPQLRKSMFPVTEFRRAYKQGRLEPSVVEALDAVGFVWNVKKHRWNLNMEALTIYKALYQDLLVRNDFFIPHDDPRWPEYLWGKKLGHIVNELRWTREKLTPAQQDQLNSIGFVWNAKEAHWQLNYKGLETFKALHGHVNISQDFIVPDQDPAWPSKLWNVQLGKFVNALRSREKCLSNERRQALDALGFEWNMLEVQWKRNLLALKTFQTIHGHLNIPVSFVVPEGDPLWPRDLWNKKLGTTAKSIQQASQLAGYPASRLDQLNKIGFFAPTI